MKSMESDSRTNMQVRNCLVWASECTKSHVATGLRLKPLDGFTAHRHYRVGQKKRGHRPTIIILSNLNRFKKNSTGRFLGKFAVKRILQTPLHLAYVATLPYETLMSAKHALNDKLQCSVVAYLRWGGVVNNQIKKGLLLSVWVNFF